jgi:anti-sigma factor RsiW
MTDTSGHIDEELQDFLDGRLNLNAAKKVESHLDQCNICRLQFEALQKAKQAAAAAAEIPVSSDLRKKIIDSLNTEDKRRKHGK